MFSGESAVDAEVAGDIIDGDATSRVDDRVADAEVALELLAGLVRSRPATVACSTEWLAKCE